MDTRITGSLDDATPEEWDEAGRTLAAKIERSISSVNKRMEGGTHYTKHTVQVWDIVEMYGLDFFEGNVLKYLLRDKDNRMEDLRKCKHYLEKLIERKL